MRRGELCGLRFNRVDLDAELIDLRRNWVGGKEKDTKTHQNRRIALDSETVTLLREQRERVADRVRSFGGEFTEDLFVFSGTRSLDHKQPYSPNAVTQRYKDMADRLKIDTHLHALRHYSATELLTAGVDLDTVAGRLGHGGGGSTTLRVYAAWVAASDRKVTGIGRRDALCVVESAKTAVLITGCGQCFTVTREQPRGEKSGCAVFRNSARVPRQLDCGFRFADVEQRDRLTRAGVSLQGA